MSDTSVERLEGPIRHTHIGGQAVIEGVMMRGKYNWAIAVRKPDGTIHTEQHDLHSAAENRAWMRKPVVRGVVALVETMSLAMKAFTVSAEFAGGEEEDEKLTSNEVTLSIVLGIALAVTIFIILPLVATNLALSIGVADVSVWERLSGSFLGGEKTLAWNIVDGIFRVLAFFLYIWAVSRMEDIQRVFAYHGAEHKVIHAYEHGLPLETDLIQKYSTQHVRCGTSFLLMVMVVAIAVFSMVPVGTLSEMWGLNGAGRFGLFLLSRILLLPVVAGLAYEITVKWAGSRPNHPVVKVMLWPGLQLQRMTTRPPDDSMVEVAVASVQMVIDRENREAGIVVEEPEVADAF